MAVRFFLLISLVAARAPALEERMSRLEVGDAIYTNVLVLSVSTTDMYFTHNGGFANAKLAALEPAIQERFHFNPEKASAQEARQRQDNALYLQMMTNAPRNETRGGAPADLVIEAEATPPVVTYEYYKMSQPKPPQVPAGMLGSAIYNFECVPEFTWHPTPTKAREGFTWRLTAIKLSLSLPIKITLPEGVTSKLRAHEEGHRKIDEHYYAIGTEGALHLGRVLKVRDFYSTHEKIEMARGHIEGEATMLIRASYRLYAQEPCRRANQYFDELTDHGRNGMDSDEAVKQAIARYEPDISQQPVWSSWIGPAETSSVE